MFLRFRCLDAKTPCRVMVENPTVVSDCLSGLLGCVRRIVIPRLVAPNMHGHDAEHQPTRTRHCQSRPIPAGGCTLTTYRSYGRLAGAVCKMAQLPQVQVAAVRASPIARLGISCTRRLHRVLATLSSSCAPAGKRVLGSVRGGPPADPWRTVQPSQPCTSRTAIRPRVDVDTAPHGRYAPPPVWADRWSRMTICLGRSHGTSTCST